jgi:dienelactone hydrolase
VLLHGCSGSHSREDIWAGRLKKWGYVALQVDSLGPRGKSNICGKPYAVPPWMRAQDAYDAKSYLATLPFVDGNRIAVMGWSHGGNSTLETAKRGLIEEKPFSATIAFYPYCGHYKWSYFNAPLLILVGEKDDWTPAYLCTSALPAEGTTTHELTLKVYPGAYLKTFTPFNGHTEKLSVYDSKEVCSCQEKDVDEPMTKPSSMKQCA